MYAITDILIAITGFGIGILVGYAVDLVIDLAALVKTPHNRVGARRTLTRATSPLITH